ncbi:hypothetical protein ACJX0J_024902, partial [Zea mays]
YLRDRANARARKKPSSREAEQRYKSAERDAKKAVAEKVNLLGESIYIILEKKILLLQSLILIYCLFEKNTRDICGNSINKTKYFYFVSIGSSTLLSPLCEKYISTCLLIFLLLI